MCIELLAYSFSKKNRARKWADFLALLGPKLEETILDIGVNTTEYSESDNYLEKHYPFPEKITAVGIGDMASFQKLYPKVQTVSTEGGKLPFSDQSFDIVYSNAVIEHVGEREKQILFLQEMYRVGKRGYLTTPNRFFPIEVHTRVPLLHLLLPKKAFDALLSLIGKKWATGEYMHLLSESDVRALFEKAGMTEYTLKKNRLLGFTVTFTLVWHKTL